MFVNESLLSKECQLTDISVKGKQVRIYDNCLPLDVFKEMQKIILSEKFFWQYASEIVNKENRMKSPIDGYDAADDMVQFEHLFYLTTEYLMWSNATSVIFPILNILMHKAWLKVKANLGLKTPKHLVGGWHYDIGTNVQAFDGAITAQLYMNTNNGYTLMETGDKVESVENRLILFPCNIMHTNVSQTDTKIRVLLNFNFF